MLKMCQVKRFILVVGFLCRFAFLEAVLKSLFRFKVEAGPSVHPQEYTKYFED
jgi:hypothetical protein